jgi:hypothetical protein
VITGLAMMATPNIGDSVMASTPVRTAAFGFTAGALAVPLFHQVGFLVLTQLGLLGARTYSLAPVPPLGVPQLVSSAFWAGLWGIVAAFVVPRRAGVLGWILFGATIPVLVAWFIVQPLKGRPPGNGFHMPAVALVPLVHGFWGFGMWLVMQALQQVTRPRLRA